MKTQCLGSVPALTGAIYGALLFLFAGIWDLGTHADLVTISGVPGTEAG